MRPTIPRAPRIQPVLLAPFSTSSAVLAVSAPPAIKSRRDLPQKVKKSYKKRANVTPVRKPQPGERKAFRKRIQLSNNSALPVTGLENLDASNMTKDESAGKMFAIPDQVVDHLRALEAFKPTQTWNLFRKPHVLQRKETVELMKKLELSAKEKKALKCVLTGSKLSGKSMAILQAMAYALLNNWVVFHIPEGTYLQRTSSHFHAPN
jgi:small subunit ribosomal protein S29